MQDILWLTFEGLDKHEILTGLGFEINDHGTLLLNGEFLRSANGEKVTADSVKAVVPGSLSVFTDVSEIEELLEEE